MNDRKEEIALRNAERKISTVNFNVGAEVQAMFDRIGSYYPVGWAGESIIILDEYVVEPPYKKVEVLSKRDGSQIEAMNRMVKLL